MRHTEHMSVGRRGGEVCSPISFFLFFKMCVPERFMHLTFLFSFFFLPMCIVDH